ncbi:MAG TPA: RNA polymerase sigma factor [Rhodanobacteraceae bacterium]|nr:RNA polymerase sigma factor [Rhodanobacteraceae bacterium]
MSTTADIDARRTETVKPNERDEAEFLAGIGRHAGIVRKVAASYANGAANRRDLEQEIVAQLWRSYPAFDGARPFATWMYRVALNVAITIARSRRRHEPVALDDDALFGGEDTAEREHGIRELRRFIGALDELNRALIVLYLDGQSYREIAEVLGISETNVATKINRVKRALRERMNPEGDHDGAR